jgi:hypothetical protein
VKEARLGGIGSLEQTRSQLRHEIQLLGGLPGDLGMNVSETLVQGADCGGV